MTTAGVRGDHRQRDRPRRSRSRCHNRSPVPRCQHDVREWLHLHRQEACRLREARPLRAAVGIPTDWDPCQTQPAAKVAPNAYVCRAGSNDDSKVCRARRRRWIGAPLCYRRHSCGAGVAGGSWWRDRTLFGQAVQM